MPRSLFDNLPPDWAASLATKDFDRQALDAIRDGAYGKPASPDVLPAMNDLYRAFHMTPLRDVRVVIVGQDPYPESANAWGLAFSTPPRTDPPLALRKVFENLERDTSIPFTRPQSGNLTPWAKRGALLLNAALTLAPASTPSRFRRWKPLLKAVLEVTSSQPRRIPVILLGGKAYDLRSAIGDPASIVPAGHPPPRNRVARRFTLFEDSTPFSDANVFLRNRGEPEFDWTLP